MKRHYSNPNKTSFAYFASGEVTLLQSFSKYALGKSSGLPQPSIIEQFILHLSTYQRPSSWKKSRQKSEEFSSLLLTVTSTALPWDLYFFKVTQPLTVCTCITVHCKGERRKTLQKPHTLPYDLRNPYRNLKTMPRNLKEILRSWILLLLPPSKKPIITLTTLPPRPF